MAFLDYAGLQRFKNKLQSEIDAKADVTDVSGKITEPSVDGTDGQVLATDGSGGRYWKTVSGGGSGGTSDYSELTNKPQIGGVVLSGNKTLADLGAASAGDVRGKLNAPAATGTAGQFLGLDSNLNPAWMSVPGGGVVINETVDEHGGTIYEITSTNVDFSGKIDKPANPASGSFLVYDGTSWVAQTLDTWQGGNY